METYLCSGGRRRRRWRSGCFLLFPGVAPLPFGLFFFSAYDAPLFPCFLGFSMGFAPVLSSGFRSQKSPVFVCVLASSSAGSLPSFSFLCFSFLPSVAFFFPPVFSSSPVCSSPLFLFEETRGYLTSTPFLFPFVPLPCSGSPFLLVFPQFFFSFSSPVSISLFS